MWQIVNATPFAAAQGWVRDLDGAETWLVVVRATFDVAKDGLLSIPRDQPPPVRETIWWGEPGLSSVRQEHDFVLEKVATDVIVEGIAHAADGTLCESVHVDLEVGPIRKSVRVTGDRIWTFGRPSAPRPFSQMPIVYERAYGGSRGVDTDGVADAFAANPVGVGFHAARGEAGVALPNVEDPSRPVHRPGDRPEPAGLGAFAAHWPQRARFAGTYDSAWERERQPLLPRDFSARHWQCAPPDQQVPGFLRGGERVEVRGASPSGRFAFTLPTVDLSMQTRFADGTLVEHPPPTLHTLHLQPAIGRATLVFHLAHRCHADVYRLLETRIRLREDRRSPADEAAEALLGG